MKAFLWIWEKYCKSHILAIPEAVGDWFDVALTPENAVLTSIATEKQTITTQP